MELGQKLAQEEATKKCAKQLREKVHQFNKDVIAMVCGTESLTPSKESLTEGCPISNEV